MMEFTQGMFWLFLAAATVASLTFVAVAVWAGTRLQERQEFYRFEFRKRMVDAGKIDGESLTGLIRYEHELGMQKAREKLLTSAFVIAGSGVGLCVGLQFIPGSVWKLGLIPVCIGVSLLAYGLFVAERTKPGAPPVGWAPKSGARD